VLETGPREEGRLDQGLQMDFARGPGRLGRGGGGAGAREADRSDQACSGRTGPGEQRLE
jgi:hypothetical protein